MKAEIYVSLKKSILDPQGKAVNNTLHEMGYENIDNIRVSKLIKLDIGADSKEEAEKQIEEICDKILANPNTETYSYKITEGAE